MKKFRVYRHPTLGYKAVKIGFSWTAFLFGIFWILYHKLWSILGLWIICYFVYAAGGSILIFIAGLIWLAVKQKWAAFGLWLLISIAAFFIDVVSSADPYIGPEIVFNLVSAFFAFSFLVGFGGNEWIEKNLLKRGFKLISETQAATPEAALATVLNQDT